MLSTVRQTLALLPPLRGARVLAAASGGADSTSLVLALLDAGARPELFHVHHGIRGASADADLDAVRDLAARYSLPFRFVRLDVPAARAPRESLEMAARRLRRAALLADAAAHTLTYIATGHTADDQAETVLLRIARGTSPSGLAAIRRAAPDPKHPGITWLRPLLDTSHDALAADLRARGVPWREDPTNASPAHRRNRVRHALLPALADALNPRISAALCRLADTAAAESGLLDALSAALAIDSPADRLSALDALSAHPALLARRALSALLATRPPSPPTRASILAAARAQKPSFPRHGKLASMVWKIGENGFHGVELFPKLASMVWKNAENGFHGVETSVFSLQQLSSTPLLLWRDASGASITATRATGWTRDPSCVYLSLDAIPADAPIVLRRPRPGDRLPIPGLGGSKKLSDIFTDLKIPRADRPLALVVEIGGRPAALPAYRVAPPYLVPSPSAPSLLLRLAPPPQPASSLS